MRSAKKLDIIIHNILALFLKNIWAVVQEIINKMINI